MTTQDTKTTHTPGPWEVGERGYDAAHAYECATVLAHHDAPGGPFRIVFAEVLPHLPSAEAKAQADANASLIATAPEMYGCLHPGELQRIADIIDCNEYHAQAEALRIMASEQRAALRKAEEGGA